MRVLQVVTDRDRRGAQVYATDLHEGLVAVGCDVTTVALAPGRFDDGLNLESLGPRRLAWRTLRELRRLAADHDVVVAHGSTCLPACAIALVGSRRRFVYRQISDPVFWASSAYRRLRTGALLRRAAHVVALSESVADVVARHYRLRRDRLTVIPNAVPADSFALATPAERARSRAQLGVSESDAFVAAYAGALVPEKGVADAIAAMASIDHCVLLIAGDGPQRDELSSLAAQGPPGRVRFLGSLDEVRPLYAAADVIVLPSRGGDSMPAVIIEANLCGVPVVACPVGAIEAVIVDGETGLIVPSGDVAALRAAIETLRQNPESTAAMGARAAVRCRERFTIAATAPSWQALLESIC